MMCVLLAAVLVGLVQVGGELAAGSVAADLPVGGDPVWSGWWVEGRSRRWDEQVSFSRWFFERDPHGCDFFDLGRERVPFDPPKGEERVRAVLRGVFEEAEGTPSVELVTALMELRELTGVEIEGVLSGGDVGRSAAVLRSAAKEERYPNLGLGRLVRVAVDSEAVEEVRLAALLGMVRVIELRSYTPSLEWALDSILDLCKKRGESDLVRAAAFRVIKLNFGMYGERVSDSEWRLGVKGAVVRALRPGRMGECPLAERVCVEVLIEILKYQGSAPNVIEPRLALELLEARLVAAAAGDESGECLVALARAYGTLTVMEHEAVGPESALFMERLKASLEFIAIDDAAWVTLALASSSVVGTEYGQSPGDWAIAAVNQIRRADKAGLLEMYLPCVHELGFDDGELMNRWVMAADSSAERGWRAFQSAESRRCFDLEHQRVVDRDAVPDAEFWRWAAPVYATFTERSDEWRPVCEVLEFARAERWSVEDQLPLVDALGMASHDEAVDALLGIIEEEEPESLLFRRAALSLGRIFEVYRAVTMGHPLRSEIYPTPGQ